MRAFAKASLTSRFFIGISIAVVGLVGGQITYAQSNESPPPPIGQAPPLPSTQNTIPAGRPPGAPPGDVRGAPMLPNPREPGSMGPVSAPPRPPGATQQMDQFPTPDIPQPTVPPTAPRPTSERVNLISFLDSTAPFVQGFDLVIMLIAGMFCWQARKAPGLTILAVSCVVSAVILLGFFLFGVFHGQGTGPQTAYIVARILAPFELLLFAIGIVLVARANRS